MGIYCNVYITLQKTTKYEIINGRNYKTDRKVFSSDNEMGRNIARVVSKNHNFTVNYVFI